MGGGERDGRVRTVFTFIATASESLMTAAFAALGSTMTRSVRASWRKRQWWIAENHALAAKHENNGRARRSASVFTREKILNRSPSAGEPGEPIDKRREEGVYVQR